MPPGNMAVQVVTKGRSEQPRRAACMPPGNMAGPGGARREWTRADGAAGARRFGPARAGAGGGPCRKGGGPSIGTASICRPRLDGGGAREDPGDAVRSKGDPPIAPWRQAHGACAVQGAARGAQGGRWRGRPLWAHSRPGCAAARRGAVGAARPAARGKAQGRHTAVPEPAAAAATAAYCGLAEQPRLSLPPHRRLAEIAKAHAQLAEQPRLSLPPHP